MTLVRLLHLAPLALAAGLATAPARAQFAQVDLDTPFVTTPANVVGVMLDLARVRPGERLIDLGSGDGRIVIEAAKRGANALGVEIDPGLVERSRELAQRAGVAALARFVTQDLFETDFSGADVITMYLLPDVNAKLSPKLFATLKPGTRIVSHDYDLGGWPPDASLEVDAPDKPVSRDKRSRIFYWLVPAKIDGRWQGQGAGAPVQFEFAQQFQRVSGTVHWAGHAYAFAGKNIEGERLAIRIDSPGRASLALDLKASDGVLAGQLREGDRAPVTVQARR